ncbi:MAG: hypothetical protein KGP28_03070 [Bdellovibrionales bacterium]|nr:hypothetical protein [Bdellovibrionales bacterium]
MLLKTLGFAFLGFLLFSSAPATDESVFISKAVFHHSVDLQSNAVEIEDELQEERVSISDQSPDSPDSFNAPSPSANGRVFPLSFVKVFFRGFIKNPNFVFCANSPRAPPPFI